MRWKWLVLWSLWAARLLPPHTRVRRLADGSEVRGRVAPDGSHEQYFGIPYASVTHRFQAPSAAPPWQGVLDAVDEHWRCPQSWWGLLVGAEQCLRLNVYAPPRRAAPLPVMLFIHGGAFKEGSASRLLYGADYLAPRGVILVTFNYRLDVLGFLSLGIQQAPGNAGLKDQLAAMKWVRRNIRSFGGDPDNITLFGESAGAASVSYHLLSPRSEGLFHRAILQSGSSLAGWARQTDPLGAARALAKALGHGTVSDPHLLYRMFMNASVSDLVLAQLPKQEGQFFVANFPFVPCVENDLNGVDVFLNDTPYNLYNKGNYYKVPVIIGFNDEEGYYFAGFEDSDSVKQIRLENTIPADLDIPEAERKSVARDLRNIYLGDADLSYDNIVQLSRLTGDSYFVFPAVLETELLLRSSGQPVYSYLFQHDGWRNFPKLISGVRFWLSPGAAHADDLFYLFNLILMPTLFEDDMIDIMTTLWTNFAKYGRPTAEAGALRWPAAERGAPLALRVSRRPRPAPLHAHRAHALRLWRALYRRHRAAR